jgi:prepilin-type N-terminal cleavage/methylation domain-containing protein
MTKTHASLPNASGYTLIEMMAVVMIIGVIATIVIANYETLTAKARYSKTKADMNGIAYAGYVSYTNNLGVWDVAPNPWTPPPGLIGPDALRTWPQSACPGYYYSWDNGALFGLNVVRVSLRRESDEVAIWSYCVNTFGGGDCDAADIYSSGSRPVEITTSNNTHFFCSE